MFTKSFVMTIGLCVVLLSCGRQDDFISDVTEVPVVTNDIDLFYAALDRMERDGYYESIVQTDYFDKGSDGLKDLINKDQLTAKDFVSYMKEHVSFFTSIRPYLTERDTYVSLTQDVLSRFDEVVPDARYKPVFFVIGRNRHGGTLTDAGFVVELQRNVLGLPDIEWGALDSTQFIPYADLDHMIAHEQVHVTQAPMHLSNSLLRMTLNEGIADYIAYKVTAKKGNEESYSYGDKNYDSLLEEWLEDLDKPVGEVRSKWVWNWGSDMDRPHDLGYYIGFRIAEQYCKRSGQTSESISALVYANDYDFIIKDSGILE